ncbi:MAG: DUF2953 domain-containing protein [Oscillospiraceae bacterium]
MIALYIILGIILFFAIILNFSLVIYVVIKEEIVLKIGAFGLRWEIDFDAQTNNQQEKEEKNKKSKKSNAKTKRKKPTEQSFFDVIKFALDMIKTFFPPVFTMIKKIRLTNLRLNMTVVSESADKTAIKSGTMSALIYTFLGQIDNLIKLKIKRISINPDFNSKEAQYDISFKIKLRFSTILRAGFSMLFKFLGKIVSANTKQIARKNIKTK